MKNKEINSNTIQNINKLLIIIRHGERIDRIGEIPKCGIMNPELTEKGKIQSFEASKIIIENLKKYGINDISPNLIQIRSSPYMRTIQTSVQLIKGLNLIFSNNINDKNNKLNKVHIDFDLRKRIKPGKKFKNEDFLYSSVDKYINFDEEIKNVEFVGDKGEFPLNEETKDQCEIRSINYVNNILKKEIDDKNNINKIFIIVGHRGPLKYILKKLGFNLIDKRILDYCSKFFFDISNGIENSTFLGNY